MGPRSPRAALRTNANPDSPDLSAALRPVQSEKGRPALGSSARDRRVSAERERPVEIRVSVPRALTPDEMTADAPPREETRRTVPPARSLHSLVQDQQRVTGHNVVRLPSAPLAAATGPHVMTAGLQNVQVAAQPPPVCVIATSGHPGAAAAHTGTAPVGTMPAAGTTARLLAQQGAQGRVIQYRR